MTRDGGQAVQGSLSCSPPRRTADGRRCMNAYGFGKKISFIKYYCFRRKVSLNSVFYDNGISFPLEMLQGLNFGQKLCLFTMKHIEIRKSFMAYRSPSHPTPHPRLCQQKLLPVYVFTYFA